MGPSTETTELFRLVTDAPMLRVHNTDDTRDKTPAQPSWKMGDLDEAGFTAALDASNLGLAIKLGGKAGLIDIEGDGPGAELEWRDLTGGMVVPQTAGWESRRGIHQLFRLTPETRRIVGEGIIKPGDLEFRLGSEKSYDLYSIIPSEGDGRKWVSGPEISTLPLELAKRISRLRVSSKECSEGQGVDDRTPDPDSPGSLFNEQVTWSELLLADGWTHAGSRQEGTIDWRRPPYGEPTKQDISADTGYCGDKLYVWTTSVPGLEALGTYSKFAYFAYTQHGGDFSSAARDLVTQGYVPAYADPFDDLEVAEEHDAAADCDVKVGSIPTELLLFPGFVEKFARYHAERSRMYDLRAGAVAGIMLQSWMMGQKVKLCDGTRPNLFAMYLTPSGFGKTSAIDTVKDVLDATGIRDNLFTRFKSWQAMEENLEASPNMMVVQEEVQDFLRNMTSGRNPAQAEFASFLKEMATASKTSYKCRSARKDDGGSGSLIDQPHVAVLMTGITKHVWEAFTPTLLEDGTLGRFWMVETDLLPKINTNRRENTGLLEEIKQHIARWVHFSTDAEDAPEALEEGQVTQGKIIAVDVDREPEATKLADEYLVKCMVNTQECADKDSVGGAAWSRASEMACRFELLLAGSAAPIGASVTKEMTKHALTLADISLKQKIHLMVNQTEADPVFEQLCRKVLGYLSTKSTKGVTKVMHRDLYRGCRMKAVEMNQVLLHLYMRREIYTDATIHVDCTKLNTRGTFACLWKYRKEHALAKKS